MTASTTIASLDPALVARIPYAFARTHGVLAYAEDPCGAEQGFSGREVLAEIVVRLFHRDGGADEVGAVGGAGDHVLADEQVPAA